MPHEPRPFARDAARPSWSPTILPHTLYGYAWQVSGSHQFLLALMSVGVFLLSAAPLEFQRRIVNDAIGGGTTDQILWLAAGYAGVAFGEGLLKLGMNIYRGWIGENAVRALRRTIHARIGHAPDEVPRAGVEGIEASMILSEAEPIGGFVGVATSEPLLQGGVLLSVFGYMVYLEPAMALISLLVFSPQLVFVPLLQGAINSRVRTRIGVMRDVSGGLIDSNHRGDGLLLSQDERIDRVFTLNMGVFKLKFTMNFLMNLMHHLGVASILAVGGWYAATGRVEVGTVVAFVSGLAKVNDPWGDLVNWFRDLMVNSVKYRLIADAVERLGR